VHFVRKGTGCIGNLRCQLLESLLRRRALFTKSCPPRFLSRRRGSRPQQQIYCSQQSFYSTPIDTLTDTDCLPISIWGSSSTFPARREGSHIMRRFQRRSSHAREFYKLHLRESASGNAASEASRLLRVQPIQRLLEWFQKKHRTSSELVLRCNTEHAPNFEAA